MQNVNFSFNKIKKVIFLVLGIVMLGFVGRCFLHGCLYKLFDFSNKSLRVPRYYGSMRTAFKNFAKVSPDVKYEITRRGSGQYDARDLTIQVNKKNISYLTYSFVIYDFNGTTKVDLMGIWDEIRKSGGDSNNDYASKKLFEKFKSEFLPRLESHKINLKPDFFNF